MPSIVSRLRTNLPVATGGPHVAAGGSLSPAFPSLPPLVPTKSSGLRSPLPNLVVTSSDSLRQYYSGGQNPTYRCPPLNPLTPVITGPAGAPGAAGVSGAAGASGATGPPGPPGPSANFANNEILAGSGTAWTFDHAPISSLPTSTSVRLYAQQYNGGPFVRLPSSAITSITGTAMVTAASWTAGVLMADYSY